LQTNRESGSFNSLSPRQSGEFVNVSLPYKSLKSKNFQSTLQHEPGHAFGMLHVNAYGRDMKRNESIMSYNPNHHTGFLRASKTPGILIPENFRVLALNDRVF